MSQTPSDTSTTPMGYSEEFTQILHRRNAETHAAHLLPHLKPGSRVLDLGCGPGTISVGLAKAVDPGELHGIDMEESQIMVARASAQAGEHMNATFHVGDATDLPFEDGYFDTAHTHAVLMHVPDTEKTLSEVMRVLKPGGVLASREMITEASFVGPQQAVDESAWQTFGRLISARGGHPNMGRDLKHVFVNADLSTSRLQDHSISLTVPRMSPSSMHLSTSGSCPMRWLVLRRSSGWRPKSSSISGATTWTDGTVIQVRSVR